MKKKNIFINILTLMMIAIMSLASCGSSEEVKEDVTVEVEEVKEEVKEETVEEETAVDTLANKDAALEAANRYLRVMPSSYNGLVRYLQEFDGFTEDEAIYAADNCGADWNEQAVKHVQYYLNTQSFTRDEMLDQLEYEGYTVEQATYGVDTVGL